MPDYDSTAKSYLAQNLNVIMSIWKMDQHSFAKLIGLNYPTFNNYMNLKSFPRIPTLLVISDVTGIPMDIYLRQAVPIHLIPEAPLLPGAHINTGMVQEPPGPKYQNENDMEKRMQKIENQIGLILELLNVASDRQK